MGAQPDGQFESVKGKRAYSSNNRFIGFTSKNHKEDQIK